MAIRKIPCFLLIAILSLTLAISEDRKERFLSVFNIVKFPNDACDAGSKNGTCYTKDECESKGGTNDGSCASGYGVCCTFAINCGESSSENNTYFESEGSESGSCSVKVCPMNSNICQIRLDFESFAITGPSVATDTVTKALNGIANTGGVEVTNAGRCLTDTFNVVTSQESPPTICGSNSNMHMYVQATPNQCNDLNFNLGDTAIGTNLVTRTWSIRVTQYDCGFENLAPPGCTQYMYGEDSGQVQSFNYNGGRHLNNQRQKVCFRREKSNCRICYTTSAYTDLAVSKGDGKTKGTKGSFKLTDCCNYGNMGKGSEIDCLRIPSLSTKDGGIVPGSGACGNAGFAVNVADGKGGVAVTGSTFPTKATTVCSKRQPFAFTFTSDEWEGGDEAKTPNRGFRIYYSQSSNNC